MKRLVFAITFLSLSIIFSFSAFASGFQLKTIGVLDVDGVTANHIWYSNGNTTITGITTAYSEVEISADGAVQKINADSSGNWIFHASLAEGDHNLVFTSGGSSISKTLTIGKVPENIGSLSKAETPTVGISFPTIALFLLGIVLLFPIPLLLFRRTRGI